MTAIRIIDSHLELADVGANDHHNELHSIASHNDTSATGVQLNILTDNSIADALHRHSELVASDGLPDPAVSVNASGKVIIYGGSNIQRNVDNATLNLIGGSNTSNGAYFQVSGKNRTSHLGSLKFWANTATAHVGSDDHKIILGHYNGASSWVPRLVVDSVGHIGAGTSAPATSALMDLTSTTGALLLTRLTTAQKNALTAVNGMVLYDSTLNKFQGYENGAWTSLI
ncbi:MAG: hypothetical protein IMF19_04465 [Proteobacteria bacterium]|nr:hypothetical protein [Pseudomonadota bacterium]